MTDGLDRTLLDLATKHALRAAGHEQSDPMVGAVLSRQQAGQTRILAIGHHTGFGEAHAEVEALEQARSAGHDLRGATMHVTLEPCSHTGKRPPCTRALIEAGIGRVICARRDEHLQARGGAQLLRQAGIDFAFTHASPRAWELSSPFMHRVRTGLPWVIAKWAQTIDGRLSTRTGHSKWISSATSRAMVHRWRARTDAIFSSAETVLADDAELTARDIYTSADVRPRRTPLRIVADRQLRLAGHIGCKLISTRSKSPIVILTTAANADSAAARELVALGIAVRGVSDDHTTGTLDLPAAISLLAAEYPLSTILLEAGARFVGTCLASGIVNELAIFTAPLLLADSPGEPNEQTGILSGRQLVREMSAAAYWRPVLRGARGDDSLVIYRAGRGMADEAPVDG